MYMYVILIGSGNLLMTVVIHIKVKQGCIVLDAGVLFQSIFWHLYLILFKNKFFFYVHVDVYILRYFCIHHAHVKYTYTYINVSRDMASENKVQLPWVVSLKLFVE